MLLIHQLSYLAIAQARRRLLPGCVTSVPRWSVLRSLWRKTKDWEAIERELWCHILPYFNSNTNTDLNLLESSKIPIRILMFTTISKNVDHIIMSRIKLSQNSPTTKCLLARNFFLVNKMISIMLVFIKFRMLWFDI